MSNPEEGPALQVIIPSTDPVIIPITGLSNSKQTVTNSNLRTFLFRTNSSKPKHGIRETMDNQIHRKRKFQKDTKNVQNKQKVLVSEFV